MVPNGSSSAQEAEADFYNSELRINWPTQIHCESFNKKLTEREEEKLTMSGQNSKSTALNCNVCRILKGV